MDALDPNYGRWTKDALIRRIEALEHELRVGKTSTPTPTPTLTPTPVPVPTEEVEGVEEVGEDKKKKPPRQKGKIDPSRYSTRVIALKLAYLGKNYGGFEHQASANVPTIEEELWKAMVKACLIFPDNPDIVDWDSIEYSKCGRTDRGVSAFGQVIGVRVRSNRPLPREEEKPATSERNGDVVATSENTTPNDGGEQAVKEDGPAPKPKREWNDLVDELAYPRLLNRLLPPDIRILAWCPTAPADFSARHHCRERQYRYFFTQPAYAPIPNSLENPKSREGNLSKMPKNGWLDIEAMRVAAKKYEGLHDFRNFCKIDGGKQLTNYHRRIFESDIVEVRDVGSALPFLSNPEFHPLLPSPTDPSATALSPSETETKQVHPKVYYFHVRGSAFLWHQIRCMVSVLFAIGQGLESPSVIDKLLDIEAEPRRPAYVLANEVPLVLWDCIFPIPVDPPSALHLPQSQVDGLDWIHMGEDNPANQHGVSGLVNHIWASWREHKMDEILSGQLLNLVTSTADLSKRLDPRAPRYAPVSQKVFEGGSHERTIGTYVPLLKKVRLASPQEANDKEARRRGFDSSAHMQEVRELRKAEFEAAMVAKSGVEVDVQSLEPGSVEVAS